VWDAGDVKQSDWIEHDFALRNDGDTAITVGEIVKSCVCTSVEVLNRIVTPGEFCHIIVRIATEGRVGSMNAQILVKEDSESNAELASLSVHAKVGPTILLRISPPRIDYGEYSIDGRPIQDLDLVATSVQSAVAPTLDVSQLTSSALVEVVAQEPGVVDTINGHPRVRMHFRIRPSLTAQGDWGGIVRLSCSNEGRTADDQLYIIGKTRVALVLSVPSVFFGNIGSPRQPMTMDVSVQIRDHGIQPKDITLETTSKFITASWLEGEPLKVKVSILPAGDRHGLFEEAVVFRAKGQEVRLPVSGRLQ
jgi:hypothetical protein